VFTHYSFGIVPACIRSELFTYNILTGHFVMVLLNLTYLHCLQHFLFEHLFNLYFFRKYEKLPNIVINACKNYIRKMNLLKMRSPQIRLCLFTFWPIASKQLNSLTTIVTLSWLGGCRGNASALGARGFWFNSRLRQWFLNLIFYFVVVFDFLSKTHYL